MLYEPAQLTSLVVRVTDRDKAADWYEAKLGVTVNRGADGSHRIASFELAGSIVSLWELQGGEALPRGSVSDPYPVVVVADGVDQYRTELEERGVRVDPMLESRQFQLFRFYDLDGNVWEVSQPRNG